MKTDKNIGVTYPWHLRVISSVLCLHMLASSVPAFAVNDLLQSVSEKRAEATVAVQPISKDEDIWQVKPRTSSRVSTPVKTGFSESPSDEEFFEIRVLSTPLVPMGATSLEENRALASALTGFRQRERQDDYSTLVGFLDTYPRSAWRFSLLSALGSLYRQSGYFSRAIDAWKTVWEQGSSSVDLRGKTVVDASLAELGKLYASLGRYDELESLIANAKGRDLEGAAHNRLVSASEGLGMMNTQPEKAFRCGPLALDRIRLAMGLPDSSKITKTESTRLGLSLLQVEQLANEAGMEFVSARRTDGAKVIVPSVVHWKSGHFAAIVREQNGMYLIQDPTFVDDIWVSRNALDDEGSGYYLVPQGELPANWVSASGDETAKVWGRGNTTQFDDKALRPYDEKCGGDPCAGKGMATYSFHSMLVSLNITDTPLGYAPPFGPAVSFTATYNQRDLNQPGSLNYSHLGPQWTFNWLSYIQAPTPGSSEANVKCYVLGGGEEEYVYSYTTNTTSKVYQTHRDSRTILIRHSADSFERRFPDGSRHIYQQTDSASVDRKVFLTEIIDPQNQSLELIYDGLKLAEIQDALGQSTTFSYGLADTRITQVQDPFGRTATFSYDGSGKLAKITDVIGISSEFTYDAGSFITVLKTPYGATTFQTGGGIISEGSTNRWLVATDPLGQQERVEFRHKAPNISISDTNAPTVDGYTFLNDYHWYRNTFFWDKKAMRDNPDTGDANFYKKARIYHWLHSEADQNVSIPIKESEKMPLESRVWYRYAGQTRTPNPSTWGGTNSQPTVIARLLDDGTTQAQLFEYNAAGKVTKSTDPLGRTTEFTYDAAGLDLLEVRQTSFGIINDLLQSITYTNHLPKSMTDAAGYTTYMGYNTRGQVIGITNALNETVVFQYNNDGYLTNIVGSIPTATTAFTYDGFGRVRTVTDSEGHTVTMSYDDLDRPVKVTYPDGTFEQLVYKHLDVELVRDRMGRWTRNFHDPLRRLVAVRDAMGRITSMDWCSCGSLESITDPMGRTTSWLRDLQGRTTAKVYPDGTSMQYSYESSTSRLKMTVDALDRTNKFKYHNDGALQYVLYGDNSVVAVKNPVYAYDWYYPRLAAVFEVGHDYIDYPVFWPHHTYRYNPVSTNLPSPGAGMLASIESPMITTGSGSYNYTNAFLYDALGRVTNQTINGTSPRTFAYDALGRMTNMINGLGTFSMAYTNATTRLHSILYPNGQKTLFDYKDVTGDQRLAEVKTLASGGATISRFAYGYSSDGIIKTWLQQQGNSTKFHEFENDDANQLVGAVVKTNNEAGTVLKRQYFNYDPAGNRTSEQIDGLMVKSEVNNLNQLTNRTKGGKMRFEGTLDEAATVTVGGNTAVVATNFAFVGYADVVAGTNSVPVVATDYSGNSRTNVYQIAVTNTTMDTVFTYDVVGRLLTKSNAASGITYYIWDGADHLIAVSNGVYRSEFYTDVFGRREHIRERVSGVIVAEKRYVWSGGQICEERNGTNFAVVKQYFPTGEKHGSTNLFYSRDHLGSIRELTDDTGAVRARYEYDPYGRRTKVSGDLESDFGFTGHFYHHRTTLHLPWFRAYDADLGRWINRDPIGENGGINLYAYAGGSPINYLDPLGLEFGDYWDIDATTTYYAEVSQNSESGLARTGAQLANILIGFFGADDAQKAGEVYADPCSGWWEKTKITAKVGVNAAGTASIAWRGFGALKAPQTLYHHTSTVRAAEIATSQSLKVGNGLFGKGVYLSTSTSSTVATLQGAHSTQNVIAVSTKAVQGAGLKLVPTWVPGSYRVVGGPVPLP